METLKVKVVGNIASYDLTQGKIVCDNDDYQIEFEFDEEWSEYSSKVGRFVTEDGYEDVPFYGTTCKAPPMHDVKYVFVGAYSAGNEKATTTGAKIPCERSILSLSKNPTPEYVMPDIEKVMAAADTVDGLVPIVGSNSLRIAVVEDHLNLTSPFVTVKSTSGVIKVPDGAKRYAYVVKMGGVTTNYVETAEFCGGTYAYQLKVNGVVVLDCSKAFKDSVESELDYLFYSNGKWIYRDGSYITWNGDEDKLDENDTEYGTMSYNQIYRRYEPIDTDVTSEVDGSAMIDVSGATEIEVVSKYIVANDYNYGGASDKDGYVEIMFEV